MKIDPNNIPKSFCILPWIHSAIDPTGDVKLCCMVDPFEFAIGTLDKNTTLKQIFQGEKYSEIRREMLEGPELPKYCVRCAQGEAARGFSYRTSMNKSFLHKIEGVEFSPDGTAEFQQAYIDYRFTNKCNFRCITCGPTYSSQHALQEKKKWPLANVGKPAIIEIDNDAVLAQFQEFAHTVERIYWAGGEPLIAEHHYDIINLVKEGQYKIDMYYNTNFSELNYKNYNVIESWKAMKGQVYIFASIDGVNEVGEAIRTGFQTDVFQNNIRKVLEANANNVELNYNITFGTANIMHLAETIIWLEQQHVVNGQYRPFKINWNPIFHPYHFSTMTMDAESRAVAIQSLKEQVEQLKTLNINGTGVQRAESMEHDVLTFVTNSSTREMPIGNAQRIFDQLKEENTTSALKFFSSVIDKRLKGTQ
jgi:organic radical activating enzyme